MRRFYRPAGQALTFVGVEWSTRPRHGTGCWQSRTHYLRPWSARQPNLTRSYSRKQCGGGWMRPGDWVRPAQPVRLETAMATRQGIHASHSWDQRYGPLHWRPPVTIGWQICRLSPGERWSCYWIRSDTSSGIVPMMSRGRRMQGWVRAGPATFGDDASRQKLQKTSPAEPPVRDTTTEPRAVQQLRSARPMRPAPCSCSMRHWSRAAKERCPPRSGRIHFVLAKGRGIGAICRKLIRPGHQPDSHPQSIKFFG